MKQIYTMMVCGLMVASASAQQIHKGDFECEWVEKAPWTSNNNAKTLVGPDTIWTISNVIGINGLGQTSVGAEAEGMNGTKGLQLFNSPNSILKSQIVPGYVTLGTTWSTSVLGSQNDGGTFGGLKFEHRPDALSFYYKRHTSPADESDATINADEPATVVAYLWKGTWTQKDVPGNIVMFGSPATVDMVNRDRNILDMETAKGGEVVKSDDAELVAVLNTTITEDAEDWTRFEMPLEYKSDAAPEMVNIILAANDYFGCAETVGKDNSLTVDDLKFVYYSRLKSLTVADTEIALEEGKYDYAVDFAMPMIESEFITCEVLGQSAVATVTLDAASAKAVITVTNVDADTDGETQHTYTVSFATAGEQQADKYNGTITIDMLGNELTGGGQAASISIAHVSENTCIFTLPNFVLNMGDSPLPLGDIVINEVAVTEENGVKTYAGHVDGMQLMGGAIVADVDLTGTTNAEGEAEMTVNVVWNNTPILVKFTGKLETGTGIASAIDEKNAPIEYYDLFGARVSKPKNGVFVRRQGNSITKVLVK